jgi:hypothetical protein
MACPYFAPTHKWEEGGWLHPSRLPLGGGWTGRCSAPGHEDAEPTHHELTEFCNLGYATACSRLPQERSWDAVRFAVARHSGAQLLLWFVCEASHLPVAHGTMEYDTSVSNWRAPHSDARIQRLGDCYVQSYLARTSRPEIEGA